MTMFVNLAVTLHALLPKDGAGRTAAQLAEQAGASKSQVLDVLTEEYLAHRVDYDVRTDAFSARKLGDRL